MLGIRRPSSPASRVPRSPGCAACATGRHRRPSPGSPGSIRGDGESCRSVEGAELNTQPSCWKQHVGLNHAIRHLGWRMRPIHGRVPARDPKVAVQYARSRPYLAAGSSIGRLNENVPARDGLCVAGSPWFSSIDTSHPGSETGQPPPSTEQALWCSGVQGDRHPRFHSNESDKVAVPLARTSSLSLDKSRKYPLDAVLMDAQTRACRERRRGPRSPSAVPS